MTTDEQIMQEMLDRATNPTSDSVDELGAQMFCMVVRSKTELITKAQEMILTKIRSSNITEATRAIALLEECMSKCGSDFQTEINKNRFLNNFITLVLAKYQGTTTPMAVKQRVMECLLLWTTEHPECTKIRTVYDMLSKESGIEHGNNQSAVAKRESILGIDEEMLAKLIKSNDPKNFERANLLIQHRVHQETRRTELLLQHKSELQEVQTTVALLNQMLDTYEEDGCKDGEASETMNVIRELNIACKKHKRANVLKLNLPELMESANEQLMSDTLETNDLLREVLERYKTVVVHAAAKVEMTNTNTTTQTTSVSNTGSGDIFADLLEDMPATTNTHRTAKELKTASVVDTTVHADDTASARVSTSDNSNNATTKNTNSKTLDELRDIFGESNVPSTQTDTKDVNEIFSSLDILEPVNLFPTPTDDADINKQTLQEDEKLSFRALPQIDKLSDELFKQTFQTNDRIGTFKKEPEKLTLNDLVKEKTHVRPTPTVRKLVANPINKVEIQHLDNAENNIDDSLLNVTTDTAVETIEEYEDDIMLTAENETKQQTIIETNKQQDVLNNIEPAAMLQSKQTNSKELNFKHLSEITIDLDDITATTQSRQLMQDDDDIAITLNFTEDRPSKHVSVIVITVLNKSKLPVKDFQFEASAKKPCKVRLLQPTATSMPAQRPFRPTTPINQVLLLLNPTGKSTDITCILGYRLGDDPDPIKESIVAKNIPFVE